MAINKIKFESQGLELGGYLSTPDSGASKIGAICITGGTASAEVLYGEWQEFLATEGIASLSFDARGIGESEGAWECKDGNYDSNVMYNSLYSRTLDTVSAVNLFRSEFRALGDQLTIIGSSMGGDIAIAANACLAWNQASVDGLILKAPAAYHPSAHRVRFGLELSKILRNPNTPGTASTNFSELARLNRPTQLIYAAGEEIVPPDIQKLYRQAVARLLSGESLSVGDSTTRHGYFRNEDEVSQKAKQITFNKSAEFMIGLSRAT